MSHRNSSDDKVSNYYSCCDMPLKDMQSALGMLKIRSRYSILVNILNVFIKYSYLKVYLKPVSFFYIYLNLFTWICCVFAIFKSQSRLEIRFLFLHKIIRSNIYHDLKTELWKNKHLFVRNLLLFERCWIDCMFGNGSRFVQCIISETVQ